MYAASTGATNLSGLPPAWIDVRAADLCRDEDASYASKLWEHGEQAELHVWPGGYAFDAAAPSATLSRVV